MLHEFTKFQCFQNMSACYCRLQSKPGRRGCPKRLKRAQPTEKVADNQKLQKQPGKKPPKILPTRYPFHDRNIIKSSKFKVQNQLALAALSGSGTMFQTGETVRLRAAFRSIFLNTFLKEALMSMSGSRDIMLARISFKF